MLVLENGKVNKRSTAYLKGELQSILDLELSEDSIEEMPEMPWLFIK
jgi:hypothetical protein